MIYRLAIIFFFIPIILTSCGTVFWPTQDTERQVSSGENYQQKLTEEQKIKLIRERQKELDSIRKWDFFVLRNNPEEALSYYLQVAEKLPEDVLIQKKIWHAYFLKKDWKNSYAAYIQVPIAELSQEQKYELLNALFFDESREQRMDELWRMMLSTGELDIYSIVDTCYTGIHNCIITIEAYTWETLSVVSLKNSIADSVKISPDYQYRNFVVATKFYELWYFRASALIASEILANRPDYTGVEKLLWFSLYQIWNYPDAKRYLLSQLEREAEDFETMIKLWDIALIQGDYTTANLYYNNVILGWYTNKTDIERKLAYSYSKLWDTPSMMKVLAYLLEWSNTTPDDAAVAISMALGNWENLKAYVWASNAIKKYPDSSIVIGLYLSSLRTVWKLKEAQEFLYTLPESMADQPVILLEKAILLLEYQWDISSAKRVFESVKDIDPSADFSLEAENYLLFIQNRELFLDTSTSTSNSSSDRPWWQ